MELKLVKKITEAKDTRSFFFEPKNDIKFLPGQYFYITLNKLSYEDPRGKTRHFTISLSPTEGNLLRITTRIRDESGFKKTLDEMKIGEFVEGEGPNGTFVFDETSEPKLTSTNHVFLAGGIGITPFRSFIKYNIDKKLDTSMHLIYSNSGDEYVFKNELEDFKKVLSSLQIDFYNSSKSGHITSEKLSGLLEKDEVQNSIFWVVGPPAFVDSIEDILSQLKINSDRIRAEKFSGY